MQARAWIYTERGRLSKTIQQGTVDVAQPTEGEVLVEIKATALNPVDEQIDRLLKFMGATPMGPPHVPCRDWSGVIQAVGSGTSWKVGDEVFGMRNAFDDSGTLQSHLILPSTSPFSHKPPGLSHTDAAALPLVYTTVYGALVRDGRLPFTPSSEEVGKRSILVLGGSSGTGTVAIQLAKKMGLRVVATCSAKNIPLVRSLGADEVIDYQTQHIPEAVLMSAHAPYAVVLDCVGGSELIPYLRNLILNDPKAPHLGIYITIVGDKTDRDSMGGAITNYFNPSQTIRHFRGRLNDYSWLPFKSFVANPRYACTMDQPSKEMLDTIPAFLESAQQVRVDSVWKFEDARKAFEKLESGRAVGKVVMELR